MLSVASGGDHFVGAGLHRSDVCYPAQGFEITAFSQGVVRLVDHDLRVRRLESRLGGRIEPISYWVTVGERTTLSGTEQKLAQLAYAVRGAVPDGMLVRVSSIDVDPQRAYRLHAAFVVDMAGAFDAAVRPRVLGSAALS